MVGQAIAKENSKPAWRKRYSIGATWPLTALVSTAAICLLACGSSGRRAAWLAAWCAEPASNACGGPPAQVTEQQISALPPLMRCRVNLLLARATRQDLELAPCYITGKSLEECREQAITGIVTGENFFECPWSPPEGWATCASTGEGSQESRRNPRDPPPIPSDTGTCTWLARLSETTGEHTEKRPTRPLHRTVGFAINR
jgi:hypothetical protein